MSVTSQEFESYVPVYDTIPEKWEEARPIFLEQFKKITNSLNFKEIGFFLDEELLSGKALFNTTNPQQFRSVLRKVIQKNPLNAGVNTIPHGINFDGNFTLVQMFASATDHPVLVAQPIPNGVDTMRMTSTDVIINSTLAYSTSIIVIEYVQEL